MDFRFSTSVFACAVLLSGVGASAGNPPYPLVFSPLPELTFIPEEFAEVEGLTFESFIGELNGDTLADVICVYSNDAMYWWENSGEAPIEYFPHLVDVHPDTRTIRQVADLNNDGKPDLVSNATPDGNFVWYENRGGEPMDVTKHVASLTSPGFVSYVAVDLNNDNRMDLAALNRATGEVYWFESDGANPPAFTAHLAAIGTDRSDGRLNYFDVDGDGAQDLVLDSLWDTYLAAFMNRLAIGSGFATEELRPTVSRDLRDAHKSVSQADYFVSTGGLSQLGWNDAGEPGNRLALVNSKSFGAPCLPTGPMGGCGDRINAFVACDFDGNGSLDYQLQLTHYVYMRSNLILCMQSGNYILNYLAFNPSPKYQCNFDLRLNQHFVDFDNDGDIDLIPQFSGATQTAINLAVQPVEVFFQFEQGSQGWQFTSPDIFHPSDGKSEDGLTIINSDNLNSFSFWESPMIRLASAGDGIITGIPTGGETLLKINCHVKTDKPNPFNAPVVRLRASSESFEQADVMIATSTGDAAFSPRFAGIDYEHYFTIPESQSALRLDFDVLNANPSDAANIETTMKHMTFSAVAMDDLGAARRDREYRFGFNEESGSMFLHGWHPAGAPGLITMPEFSETSGGLAIRANQAAQNQFTFGFWDSAGSPDPVVLEGNRLYRIRFTVASDGTLENRKDIPNFRVRINTADFRGAAYVNAESITNNSRIPYAGNPLTYDVWFACPPQLAGQPMLLAFDYLHYAEEPAGWQTKVFLKNVAVDSFEVPASN